MDYLRASGTHKIGSILWVLSEGGCWWSNGCMSAMNGTGWQRVGGSRRPAVWAANGQGRVAYSRLRCAPARQAVLRPPNFRRINVACGRIGDLRNSHARYFRIQGNHRIHKICRICRICVRKTGVGSLKPGFLPVRFTNSILSNNVDACCTESVRRYDYDRFAIGATFAQRGALALNPIG